MLIFFAGVSAAKKKKDHLCVLCVFAVKGFSFRFLLQFKYIDDSSPSFAGILLDGPEFAALSCRRKNVSWPIFLLEISKKLY